MLRFKKTLMIFVLIMFGLVINTSMIAMAENSDIDQIAEADDPSVDEDIDTAEQSCQDCVDDESVDEDTVTAEQSCQDCDDDQLSDELLADTHSLFGTRIYPGNGHWGSWTRWAICPRGEYAIGYAMRVEQPVGKGDDTAMNAIQLYCGNRLGQYTRTIIPHHGHWGNWHAGAICRNGTFINQARIKIEAPIGSGDDTAANSVRFKCTNNSEIAGYGEGPWGSWGLWRGCPRGKVINGVAARIERPQGKGDDTALNGLAFSCVNAPR